MFTRYVGFQFNIYSGHRTAAPADSSSHIVICELIVAFDTNGFVERHTRFTSVPLLFTDYLDDEVGEIAWWPLTWESSLGTAKWWWVLAAVAMVHIIRGFVFDIWVSEPHSTLMY